MKKENTTKLYIISFGDSRKYRMFYDAKTGKAKSALLPFVEYEKELNAYLGGLFPGETFAYYTTPRITEVEAAHADKYADYPLFDSKAKEEVKEELVREINVMNDNRALNDNDPWGKI